MKSTCFEISEELLCAIPGNRSFNKEVEHQFRCIVRRIKYTSGYQKLTIPFIKFIMPWERIHNGAVMSQLCVRWMKVFLSTLTHQVTHRPRLGYEGGLGGEILCVPSPSPSFLYLSYFALYRWLILPNTKDQINSKSYLKEIHTTTRVQSHLILVNSFCNAFQN